MTAPAIDRPLPGRVLVAVVPVARVGAGVSLPLHELERAEAIRHAGARATFLAGRRLARHLLGRLLGHAPEAVPIQVEPGGRPVLAGGEGGLTFSISHCGPWVGLAVAAHEPVGLDIEHEAPPDADGVAEVIMAPAELRAFREVSTDRCAGAFLRAWTRKEALLKAAGTGFSVDPREIPVTSSTCKGVDGRSYRICDLPLDEPAGAVALAGEGPPPVLSVASAAELGLP
jgi:4'-phosphopantetheinyl transferase